jgi:hypothetical protein
MLLAMWMALRKLGYRTYHFKEVGDPQNVKERHMWCWREALLAKLCGSGKPYGKAEFNKLLGRYNVRLLRTPLERAVPSNLGHDYRP